MILGSLILDLVDEGVQMRVTSSAARLEVSWPSGAGPEGEEEVVVVVKGYGTAQSSLRVA